MEYAKYVSHKEVSAAKITTVDKGSDGGIVVYLEGGFEPVTFSHEQMRHKPLPEQNWYLVLYANGYVSFSPQQAFEDGYTLQEPAYTDFIVADLAGVDDPYGINREYTAQSPLQSKGAATDGETKPE